MKILVVSDDPNLRAGAEFAFSDDEEISLATDSRDAWPKLDEATDVVVVDIQTGRAGGFNLTRDIRAANKLRDVPILMLLERDQDRWLARQAGADVARVKPLTASDLVSEIRSLTA
ncbi:MAG: response regulator [Actinomycetota bacterium]|nr:response regulator [Actinomycetota bacterium]